MRTNNLDLVVYSALAAVLAYVVIFGGFGLAMQKCDAQDSKAKAPAAHVVKANGKVAVCVAVTKTLTVCTLR